MKTYTEAISAMRLAQLAAKGKGQAAAAKMKADNLTSTATQDKPKSTPQKALPGSKGGALAGGALAVRPKTSANITTTSTPSKPKSSALATTKSTGSSAPKKDAVGKRAKPTGGYMSEPDGPSQPRKLTEPTGGDLGGEAKKKSRKKFKLNKPKLKNPLKPSGDAREGGADDVYRGEYKDTAS